MDPTLNVPTVYFIDAASIERIKRLVKSLKRAEAAKHRKSSRTSQRGGAFTRPRYRLTDKPYQAPASFANPLWDDPVRQRLRLAGQSRGVMALERLNALLKIRADHLNRRIPLPRGWTRYSLNGMINQLLTLYKKDIELSAFPMNKSMTREEALSVLTGVKGLPDKFANVALGLRQAQQDRDAKLDILETAQDRLVQRQESDHDELNAILNNLGKSNFYQYANILEALRPQRQVEQASPVGVQTRSRTQQRKKNEQR